MLISEQLNTKTTDSCRFDYINEGEEFIEQHVFCFQVSGDLHIYDGEKKQKFEPGDFRFCRRNGLAKFRKVEQNGEKFKSIAIYLDQEVLKQIHLDFKRKAVVDSTRKSAIIPIKSHFLYESYIDSIMAYMKLPVEEQKSFMKLKAKELIFLILKINPELYDTLFDFNEPGKIDLEAFMKSNYRFNVSLNRFAFLSGRSISTFKRDFSKTFKTTPGKWLLDKRLQEAKHLLTNKNLKPMDVYLDIGFENLSHFSFAYKQKFGVSPSEEGSLSA